MESKRSPFAFQKGSFCSPKGVLLHGKRSPFAPQKESFCERAVMLWGFYLIFSIVQPADSRSSQNCGYDLVTT